MPQKSSDNLVRIIGGKWRGRKISFPAGADVRPTPGRVRETLFNWLQSDIRGAHCLELFGGSGALSLEALSRGAEKATVIDRDRDVCRQLIRNAALMPGAEETLTVVTADAIDFLDKLETEASFDIVFLDPPFNGDHLEIVESILVSKLSSEYILYLESDQEPPEEYARMKRVRNKRAGQVHYGLYRP